MECPSPYVFVLLTPVYSCILTFHHSSRTCILTDFSKRAWGSRCGFWFI